MSTGRGLVEKWGSVECHSPSDSGQLGVHLGDYMALE